MNKYRNIRNSLFRQFFLAVVIFFIVILADVLITNKIVNNIIRKTNENSNIKIMKQIDAKTNEFYKSICNVMTLISYEQTSYNYFTQDNLSRINNYDDLISILSDTMMVQEDIAGISMYDTGKNNIACVGKKFDIFRKVNMVKEISFSNIFRPNSTSTSYYTVSYPVFDLKNQNYDKQIGMIVFLMNTNKFNTFLQGVQTTKNSNIYLLDTHNSVIACEGNYKVDILSEKRMESSKTSYVKVINQKDTGWRIVSIIPVHELSSGMGTVKSVLLFTLFIIFLAIIALLNFCYIIIIKPIHKLDLFVNRSAENPLERVKIGGINEIGMLAGNLNHMLDERDSMNEKLRQSQRKIFETELAKKQIQILAYRNQINPHFLYNTFDCIRAMALYYDVDDIADITMALSKVFRYAIKGENIVTLEEEVNYTREYAKIINYRFAGKIQINIDIEEKVRNKQVIKLILQPVVENAVFHGLEQKMENGYVNVTISAFDNNMLSLIISDNGCGMEKDKLDCIVYHMKRHSLNKSSENDSIGIMNIYQRLLLFYGENMDFSIISTVGEGTTVSILIPDEVKIGADEANV